MNKNKVFYVLLIGFASLFMFNMDVYGDEEKYSYSSLEEAAKNMSCNDLIKNDYLNTSNLDSIIFDGSSYDANCVYSYSYPTGTKFGVGPLQGSIGEGYWGEETCVIFQLAFNKDGTYMAKHYGSYDLNLAIGAQRDGFFGRVLSLYEYTSISSSGTSTYIATANGMCPISVGFSRGFLGNSDESGIVLDNFVLNPGGLDTMNRIYRSDIEVEIPPLLTKVDSGDTLTCEGILGGSGVALLRIVKNLLFIVVPIILLVMGSLDFAQSVFASDENAIKKAQGKFIKRLIVAVVIFLIPSILGLILDIASLIWDEIDSTMCGIR